MARVPSASSWDLFTNSGEQRPARNKAWPTAPPWRRSRPPRTSTDHEESVPPLDPTTQQRGSVFRLPRHDGCITPAGERLRLAVNAAIHLRRPLLVTGNPGCGKTSLAYAIAWELDLGPVLRWSISPRTQLVEDGLYQYDAISRLQDSQIPRELKESGGDGKVFGSPVADYIKLGPVGTAFLPYGRPRVLLVDEIDKSDIQLPNELLSLFDEGLYEIPPLQREARRFAEGSPESAKQSAMKSVKQKVRTADPEVTADIYDGVVQCLEFPIVVMTSNRERDFPAAFNRRCIRIEMPRPTEEDTLKDLVLSHFRERKPAIPLKDEDQVPQEIRKFLNHPDQADLATDQLLNALYLLTLQDWQSPTEKEIEELRTILYRGLHARDGAD